MSKWVRTIGIGCLSIAITSAVFFGEGNVNSYAEDGDSYKEEMKRALEAFENMDASSQQQMIASMIASGVTNTDLSRKDIETMMMEIQMNRVDLLESQLTEQVNSIQSKMNQIKNYSQLIKVAQTELDRLRDGKKIENEEHKEMIGTLLLFIKGVVGEEVLLESENKKELEPKYKKELESLDVETLEKCISHIKTKVDLMSNSQQMDMIRLQSLQNKRNEAIEIMTNSIQKTQRIQDLINENIR